MQTTPLAKAITTLEGILVVASDVVMGAVATIDPSTLSPKYAAIAVAVQHVALLISRGVIKAKAVPRIYTDVTTAKDPLAELLTEVEAAAGGKPIEPVA